MVYRAPFPYKQGQATQRRDMNSAANAPDPPQSTRVVEFSAIRPVPFCAMQFADMGAVIPRIEAPSARGAVANGLDTELWTTSRVAGLIHKAFRVRFHRSHVARLLHDLGISCQKPERRAMERDEQRTSGSTAQMRATAAAPRRRPRGGGAEGSPNHIRWFSERPLGPSAAEARCNPASARAQITAHGPRPPPARAPGTGPCCGRGRLNPIPLSSTTASASAPARSGTGRRRGRSPPPRRSVPPGPC